VSTNNKFGEYAVAATAFFVSVCSLFIYVYQSKLMAEQQQVAVWPYVQWSTTNAESFDLQAENKGVGPALVRKVVMKYKGQVVAGNRGLVAAVLGPDRDLNWENSALQGIVLSPGEKVTMFSIPDKLAGRAFEAKLDAGQFAMEITYCSIYGRCWTSTGFTAKRAPDDKSIDY
jgi:hypothetical protein